MQPSALWPLGLDSVLDRVHARSLRGGPVTLAELRGPTTGIEPDD
jgi:hypothetical protein